MLRKLCLECAHVFSEHSGKQKYFSCEKVKEMSKTGSIGTRGEIIERKGCYDRMVSAFDS